jgi:hypothetical protein
MSNNAATLGNVQDIRPVVSAVTATVVFVRGISIKRFAPANRRREFAVLEHNQNSHPSHCQNDETLR